MEMIMRTQTSQQQNTGQEGIHTHASELGDVQRLPGVRNRTASFSNQGKLQRFARNDAGRNTRVIFPVQAKLKLGRPNDRYEQEADRVADEVMRMPQPEGITVSMYEEEKIQTKAIAGKITPLVQGDAGTVSNEISSDIQSLQGGGRPLSNSERGFFEPRFGVDFSNVRLHDDRKSSNIAQSINARAFTVGNDVAFGAGEYSRDTSKGKRILAHELVHVVQNNSCCIGLDISGLYNNRGMNQEYIRRSNGDDDFEEWEEWVVERSEDEEERTVRRPPRSRGRRYLREIRIGGEDGVIYRIGFQSRGLQIRSIYREWNGVVWITHYNRESRQERTETAVSFHALMSAHYIASATEFMGDLAEAEAAIIAELFPGARVARIATNIIWAGLIFCAYREEISDLIEEVSQLNEGLDWLQENTPHSLQVFITTTLSVRVGQELPTGLSPVDIGRNIGRTLRDFHTFARLIISIVRGVRRGPSAGLTAGLRIFVSTGRPIVRRIPLTSTRIRRVVETIRPYIGAIRSVRGAVSAVGRIRDRIAEDSREEVISTLAGILGVTPDNPMIDAVIREFADDQTEEKLIQVLNAFRHFIELSDNLADSLGHQ